MFRLGKPGDFSSALSRSPRLKFILAWATFAGLVIPSAALMSFGAPEEYVLPGMLVAIPLFQYAIFCSFPALNRDAGIGSKKQYAPLTNVISVSLSETVVASDSVVITITPAAVTIRAATGTLTFAGSAVENRQVEDRNRIAGESVMIAA